MAENRKFSLEERQKLAELIKEEEDRMDKIEAAKKIMEEVKAGKVFIGGDSGKNIKFDYENLKPGNWYEVVPCPSTWSYPGYDLMYIGKDGDKYVFVGDNSEEHMDITEMTVNEYGFPVPNLLDKTMPEIFETVKKFLEDTKAYTKNIRWLFWLLAQEPPEDPTTADDYYDEIDNIKIFTKEAIPLFCFGCEYFPCEIYTEERIGSAPYQEEDEEDDEE